MPLTISSKISALTGITGDALAILVPEDKAGFDAAKSAAKTVAGVAAENVFASGDVTGKRDALTLVYGNKKLPRVFLIGVGKMADLTPERLRRAAAAGAKSAQRGKVKNLSILMPASPLSTEDTAFVLAEGAGLAAYKFDRWYTFNKGKDKPNRLTGVTIISTKQGDAKYLKSATAAAQIIVEGVNFARDLANAPSNEVTPAELANRAVASGRKYGFKVKVLETKDQKRLGMGGLLGVNAGSVRPAKFIVMEYNGGKAGDKPFVIVGKGLTFDSGGISLKPGAGMADMKMDMHGSATTIATLQTVARLKLKLNVVGLVPSTENMPSGSAVKPGDVLVHMNGITSEVDNTDAEGRLVLADALAYADKFYKPCGVVDLATLTGAVVVGLGNHATGMMGNDDALKSKLKAAGERVFERMCELPLYEEYEDQIKSDVADVKNVGGRWAGPITAALFLKKFVGDWPWVHLDIAGSGMWDKEGPYSPKGGTGVGVRLLTNMLMHWK